MYQGPYGNQQGQYPGQYQGAAPPGGAGPPPGGAYAQAPPPQPSYQQQQQQGQYGGGAYAPAPPQHSSYPPGGGGGGSYPAGQQAPRQQGYGQAPSGYGGGGAYSSYAGAAPAAAQPPPPSAPYAPQQQQQQQYGGQGGGGYGGGQGQGSAYGGYAGGGAQGPPSAAYGGGGSAQGAYGQQQQAQPPPPQQQYYPQQQQQHYGGSGAGGAPPQAAAAAAPAYTGGQYSGYPSQQQQKQPVGDFQGPSHGWQQRERDRQGPGGYGRGREPRGPPGGPPMGRSGPPGAPPSRRRHESDHYGPSGPKQMKQQRGKAGALPGRGGGKGGPREHHGDRDHHHHDRHHHSSRRRSPSPAHEAPPVASVHLPAYQLGATPSMDYLEVSRRFDRMVMPEDFVCAVRRPTPGDPSVAVEGAAASVSPGLGLSRSLDLSRALPVHHEVLAAKVEAGPLAAYDPAVPAASAVPANAVLPGAAPTPTDAPAATAADPPAPGSTVYNAKVVLLSGLGETERAAAMAGPSRPGGDHVSRLVKFVVARAERAGNKSGIFALGGRCDPGLDGDPEGPDGDAALIRAATRHVAAQTGVDLRPCTRWHRALDIRYLRPVAVSPGEGGSGDGGKGEGSGSGHSVEGETGYHEVTVLFVVDDAQAALPAAEAWDAAWAERHTPRAVPPAPEPPAPEEPPAAAAGDDEDGPEDGELPEPEPAPAPSQEKSKKAAPQQPAAPALLCIGLQNTVLRLKTMSISLDGLLDYNESDTDEATFELSMLGEALHEEFSRDAGGSILRALRQRPWAVAAKAVSGHKRKAAAVAVAAATGEEGGKRVKTEGGEEAEAPAEFIAMDAEGAVKQEEEVEGAVKKEEEGAETEAPAAAEADGVKEEPAAAQGEPEAEPDAGASPPDQPQEGGDGDATVVVPPAVSAALTEFELACGYFDAAGAGYIATDDVQVIVESLGAGLHHGAARRLAHRAAAFAGKPARLDYRRLCRHR